MENLITTTPTTSTRTRTTFVTIGDPFPDPKQQAYEIPLPPAVLVLQPRLSGTHSHLAFATLPLVTISVAFLKLTASSRPSAPPSGSPKCLRVGHWLILYTLKSDLLTYLLEKLKIDAGPTANLINRAIVIIIINIRSSSSSLLLVDDIGCISKERY